MPREQPVLAIRRWESPLLAVAVMVARADLAVGTVLGGRFRIERKLGAGTMGTVYEVEHVLTRHRRALKLLDPELREHAETWERFRREASIAARIESPRVVSVFDAGELPEGDAYVLMELLEGESLASFLSRKAPLPVPEIAGLVREAALGLHAAHEAGIVHRDVKPANLFLCEDGRLKVLDFGICRFAPDLTQLESRTVDPSALGTPSFMSPEQVRGVPDLDRRVDVWALGVLLYIGAVGERPFRAGSLPELAIAIDRGRRTPIPDSVPPAFAEVIDRAMATEREARYATAAALAEALAPFVGATAPPLPTVRRSSRAPIVLAIVSLVALAAVFAFVSRRPAPPIEPVVIASAPSVPVTPIVSASAPSVVPSTTVSAPPVATSKPTASVPLHRDNPYR